MDERGQASVEVLAAVPAILLAAVLCLQLLATGYSLTLADGAAEGGRLTVRLHPPSPLAAVGRALEVSSTAWVRRPEDAG